MNYDVEWDAVLKCYCLHYHGEMICLGAPDLNQARTEAANIVENWQ